LILDLRDTPSGGNTGVAEAIMGRFVREAKPYQRHELPGGGWKGRSRLWLQYVTPRGPFPYDGPLAVLVDHWTGSMGEGMAIGFDAMKRGVVVGTRMAGLNGAVYSSTLAKTGIGFSYPAERLFHAGGVPRHAWAPPVLVDLARQDGEERDAILDRGLAALAARP
jgi:C-terminal processing protease CtpA/Prc